MKCPDCGADLDSVIIEVFSTKPFEVDHERKQLIPRPNHDWDTDEYACHCPHCDSLNVDSMLTEYDLQDGMRSLV